MEKKKLKLSVISAIHYLKLFYRLALFAAAIIYIAGRVRREEEPFQGLEGEHGLLIVIWIIYAVEMMLRFFPSDYESMGSQRQFARNYQPTGETNPQSPPWQRTFLAAASWIFLNAVIGVLYFAELIDRDILILISLAYGVCDMICILFFCPFQTWHLEPSGDVAGAAGAVGDHVSYAPGALFRQDKCQREMRELPGEALSP